MATGPNGVRPRQASTLYLRVPADDWNKVSLGYKTEFRLSGKAASYPHFLQIVLPTAVVAYMTRQSGDHAELLMVLEQSWVEPLGAISEESLKREGYPDMAHFRRYWTTRTKARFRPLSKAQVFRVRNLLDGDRELLGGVLFDRLYGDYTGADTEPSLLSRRGALSAGLR